MRRLTPAELQGIRDMRDHFTREELADKGVTGPFVGVLNLMLDHIDTADQDCERLRAALNALLRYGLKMPLLLQEQVRIALKRSSG